MNYNERIQAEVAKERAERHAYLAAGQARLDAIPTDLIKRACGAAIWKQMDREANFCLLDLVASGVAETQADQRRIDRADAIRTEIMQRDERIIGYATKTPPKSWDTLDGPRWMLRSDAVFHVELESRNGWSNDPYIQLVECYADGEMSVIAEWHNGQWISPYEAAGFLPRSI